MIERPVGNMKFPLEVEMTIGMWLDVCKAGASFLFIQGAFTSTIMALLFGCFAFMGAHKNTSLVQLLLLSALSWVFGLIPHAFLILSAAVWVDRQNCYEQYGTYDQCMAEHGDTYDCQYCPQEPPD